MKEAKDQQKVSLIFYSEEDGKRTKVDKWVIEIGKKYTIGRSKKKVDISIQDISISRVQAEFIFYNIDKIMIKDFDSSNGTFINKIKIEPNKEVYFSIRDILSVGDEKNELLFEIPKEMKRYEEERKIRDDFDDKRENQKNEKINNFRYIKNENKIIDENKNYYNNIKNEQSPGGRSHAVGR